MKQQLNKQNTPSPEAFILDEYEQQIEDDIAKGLYVPISKEEFFSKLESGIYHKQHKKATPVA